MTNERACASEKGMPALIKHIGDMQEVAGKLNGLLRALVFLDEEGASRPDREAVAYVALDLAKSLNEGLDIVNLPEVQP